MNMVETWSAGMPSVMPSVEGQHGQELAGAKGNGDIDDPDEAIGEGIGTQGGGHDGRLLESSDREPSDPIDHGLRTRRFGQPQGGGQHAQDAAYCPKADASPHKEFQGDVNKIDFTFDGGYRGRWALSTELSLGLFGASLLGISLAFEAFEFLAHVAIVIGAALGFLFPTLSTLVDFIGGTHGDSHPSLASEVERATRSHNDHPGS